MATELFLVRGAPGVGKRDAVDRLRRQLSTGAIVDVEAFRAMFTRPSITDRQQHLIAMRVARDAALEFVRSKVVPVVMVDTFTSGKLAGLVSELDLPFRIASIYLDPAVLRERLIRKGATPRDVESASMINAEIAVRRHPNEKFVDATALDAEAVAGSLRRWMRRP